MVAGPRPRATRTLHKSPALEKRGSVLRLFSEVEESLGTWGPSHEGLEWKVLTPGLSRDMSIGSDYGVST